MSLWENDLIQFARLLDEFNAVGLVEDQERQICESMDISGDQLTELFERANAVWEVAKRKVADGHHKRSQSNPGDFGA